jgi:nitroreductase
MMTLPRLVPAPKIDSRSDDELVRRARAFYEVMRRRRTIRDFSDRPVPREVIEHCIRAAGTAPSGANLQPWHFVAVSDPALKHEIRAAPEKEEKEFYEHRAESLAGSAGAAGHGFQQAVLGDCTVADRRVRATVPNSGRRNTFADLLRDRVGWHGNRRTGHGGAFVRAGLINTHTEPDGVPESNSQ